MFYVLHPCVCEYLGFQVPCESERILLSADSQAFELLVQIDNLVKGASGQALQNLNLMMGFPENTGLLYQPLFP